MKVKNLNFIEKYVEKMVLAVALLFCVGVLWLKSTGTPYRVELDGVGEVGPDQIDDELGKIADDLRRKLAEGEIDRPRLPDFTIEFVTESKKDIAPELFVWDIGKPPLKVIGDPTWERDFLYIPPIPVPSNLAARQGFGVLASPTDDRQTPDFIAMLGLRDDRPWDVRWVSVSAEFDLDEWRYNLGAKPPASSPQQKIPERWWRRKLGIVDVALERQLWQAGQWTEAEIVPLLPNAEFSYRDSQGPWSTTEARVVVTRIRDNQEDVVQPLFPSLLVGDWRRPDVNLTTEQWNVYTTLIHRIRQVRKAIREHPDSKKVTVGQPAPPRVVRRPGRSDKEKKTGPTLDELKAERDTLIRQHDTLIGKPTEATLLKGTDEPAEGDEFQDDLLPDVLTVWGHDMTAQPGATYRYRIVVAVLNPLFQEDAVPPQQKEQFKELLSLLSPVSEWSQPITVEPRTQFFMTGIDAAARDAATVEVYSIFGGRRLSRMFKPKPGGIIGDIVDVELNGFTYPVDMRIDAIVVDVEEDAMSGSVGLNETTPRLTYHDQASGLLLQRTAEIDRTSDDRKRMRSDASP